MSVLEATMLMPPKLRFDAAIPSRTHIDAYPGLRTHGPFDSSRVSLPPQSVLFVFPSALQPLAHQLAAAIRNGHGSVPSFQTLFGVPLTGETMTSLAIDAELGSPEQAAASYRSAIEAWSKHNNRPEPQLAFVLVPHSERWETDRPYYQAKASFARLGIPTQMVTTELVGDAKQFGWSIANIGLQAFAKLGGIPWTIESPAEDTDIVIGVGRSDITRHDGITRIFGYAVSFVGNGVYRQTWSFTPAADESEYEQRLEDALFAALSSDADLDQPARRLVLHLAKKTGHREIAAARRAMKRAGVSIPAAFLRLDDSTLFDLADGSQETLAPPKGLAVRLDEWRMLLQSNGLTALGPPDSPLLAELNEESDVGSEALDELVAQAFRLSHANWRGFNARSKPVTLAYGDLLARLVGYLEEVSTWDPSLLRSELQSRPWFL